MALVEFSRLRSGSKSRRRKFLCKKTASLMVATFILLPFLIPQMSVYAAGTVDINDPAVFLKQKPGDQQCTLVAATMMIRRAAILVGDPGWKSITQEAVFPVAWNGGLRDSFSYAVYSVGITRFGSKTTAEQKKEIFIEELKKHPEGLAIYKKDTHAVLLTDYINGVFYCADPAGSRADGRIPISQAYKVTIENATSYWHMTSQVVLSNGEINPALKYMPKPSPSYTPDPASYKVAYSRALSLKSTKMTGSDVKYVQACLRYLGYDVTVNGKFDDATSRAIGRFQRDYGLVPDSKCGTKTWEALEKAVADNPAPLAVSVSVNEPTVYPDEQVTLTAKANRKNLTYQWYYKKSGASAWTLWSGHTTASTTGIANDTWNGIQFYCQVTDSSGDTAKSDAVKLSVIPRLQITAQPANITAKEGAAAAFAVNASGKGLQYQWYYKKSGATAWTLWSGHDTAVTSALVNTSWDGMKVYCKVTDVRGKSVNSNAAAITVIPALKITTQPVSITAALGSTFTLSIKAAGSGLKYQWYFKKKGASAFTAWSGHTGASESVTPNDTWNGIQLYCVVKDAFGDSVKSNTVTVTLTTPKITAQPVSTTFALGNAVTLSLKATGTGLKYQWYYKKVGDAEFTAWNGHTSASEAVTPNATWNGIKLYCLVTDSADNTVKSNVITLSLV